MPGKREKKKHGNAQPRADSFRATSARLLAEADDAERLANQVWSRLELAKQQLADGVAPHLARDSVRIYDAAWSDLVAQRQRLLDEYAQQTTRARGHSHVDGTDAADRAA